MEILIALLMALGFMSPDSNIWVDNDDEFKQATAEDLEKYMAEENLTWEDIKMMDVDRNGK